MGYSLFQTSTLGMMSQAHALDTLGTNIANVNTGGFKRTDTRFSTVLGGNIRTGAGSNSTISYASPNGASGGIKPKDFQTLDQQGLLKATTRDLDLAIAGDGFFLVSPTLQVSNQILYTRDGSFDINVAGAPVTAIGDDGNTINVRQGFLTDKNGFFLLGFAPEVDGSFSETAALQALRVDQFAFTNSFNATTLANLTLNLPAQTGFGDPNENLSLTIVDSNGKVRAITASFVKTPTANQWQMLLSGDNLTNSTLGPGGAFSLATGAGTGKLLELDVATREIRIKAEQVPSAGFPGAFIGLKVGDSITIAGSGAGNNGTFTIGAVSSDFATITLDATTPFTGLSENLSTPVTLSSNRVVGDPLVFSNQGTLSSPSSFTTNLTWSDGATTNFALDISGLTQFNGAFLLVDFQQNGLSSSDLKDVTFDTAGNVIGQFNDGSARKIYKIPLAAFANPNGLLEGNGNTYEETSLSGSRRTVFADTSGIALLSPATVELSNVELATQFTQMIRVQQAYNSSATVFKTVDEMLMAARDLKA